MKHLHVHQQYDHTPHGAGTAVAPVTDVYVYIVDKVVNSVNPVIGATLTSAEVNNYAIATDWNVTIT